MNIDLLAFIKTLPMVRYNSCGDAVGFDTIYSELGLNNKDMLEMELLKLEEAGKIKIHRDDDVIFAVSI